MLRKPRSGLRPRSGIAPAPSPAARLAAAEAALERGTALENLLIATSNAFVRASSEEIDAEIARALEAFARFLPADRATLWLVSEDETTLSPKIVWRAPDLPVAEPPSVPLASFAWSFEKLR